MRNRTQRWLQIVPIHDPIERHLAAISRMMLIGLGITVVLSSLLYLLSERNLANAVRPITIANSASQSVNFERGVRRIAEPWPVNVWRDPL